MLHASSASQQPQSGRRRSRFLLPTLIAAAILASSIVRTIVLAQTTDRDPVLTTAHFAFYSEFTSNLHHALVASGRARRAGGAELFRNGPAKACYDALPAAERVAWTRAVDYYTEIISPLPYTDRPATVARLVLAGVIRPDAMRSPSERRLVDILAAFRDAASPAYRECGWVMHDMGNRRWISNVAASLARYETSIGERLPQLFGTPWAGLPFRVDVVDLGDPLGANSMNLNPPGLHILVSSSVASAQGPAALETLFHEASHFLTGFNAPLPEALASAVRGRQNVASGDLTHPVHFFMTGEVVRRALADGGESSYVPLLYALNLFSDRFREAVQRTWPAYMDGKRSMADAASDLIAVLSDSSPDRRGR